MSDPTVGVIGAGQMGAGIAQVCAMAGYDVVLQDVEQRFVDRGMGVIRTDLDKGVAKGKVEPSVRDGALGRVVGTTDVQKLAPAFLVVEAVVEDPAIKAKVLAQADTILGPSAILATNTSSISITELAAATKRPDRFIGMHFMNPVPRMQLIEVIRGLATSDSTLAVVMEVAQRLGKTALQCNDFPGFVSNRVLMPMINEAIFCVEEGVGTPEAIDGIMQLGMNHPMGPLALADLIGLDTCLSIMVVLHEGFGDSKYRPAPLLRKMVRAGRLGRKSGHGFYRYPSA